MIAEGSQLWQYLSPAQRVLAADGAFLLRDSAIHKDQEPTDYSYLVFPFAKLYEGFLKQLFLDLGIIAKRDYESDRFRIGKALSPHLVRRLRGRSAYGELEQQFGASLATQLWEAWKEGRNLVFHYFPHNLRALSHEQAQHVIEKLISAMESAVMTTRVLDKHAT
jgi:hypothetical protein